MFSARIARWRDESRVRRILGREARVGEARVLYRRPGARTVQIRLRDDGRRIVLKSFERAEDAALEARNLVIAGAIPGIRTPALLGRNGTSLVQEFVEGRALTRVHRDVRDRDFAEFGRSAVRNLVSIHAARPAVEGRAELRRPFTPSALAPWIRRSWRKIERVGFTAYARQTGALPREWIGLLREERIRTLVRDLDGERDGVLGHGDYHLGNLVLTDSGEIVTLDWEKLCLASPWYDLCGTVSHLRRVDGTGLLDLYRSEMQRRGLLLHVSASQARSRARSGTLCRWLYYARIYAGALAAPGSDVARSRFRATLDAMAELIG